MSKKIRFAVIGTSGIAPAHVNALQNCPNSEVVYIHSRDISRARELARRFDLTPTKSYKRILADRAIEAVDIVTEPSRHAKLALEAMKYRKHVLIEKPLDIDISLAQKVVRKASKASTTIGVISQKRFEPPIRKMKAEFDRGSIGKPYLAEVKLLWKRTSQYYHQGNGWRGIEGSVLVKELFGGKRKSPLKISRAKPNNQIIL